MAKKTENKRTLENVIGYILSIGGVIGFLASFILTIEKIQLLMNPAFVPSCNLSPLLSCGSVMKTEQASVFGFANSLLGVAGFAAIITIGIGILAGAKYKRWFWLGIQAGATFGLLFVHWLMYQSIFVIGKLCPYCMVVWSVMIPLFLYVTFYNLRVDNIKVSKKYQPISKFLQRHHGDILILWFVAIITTILVRFWDYWQTLI
jgi:uncharacterized membrane protein